ncbi:MAG: hypothetical protein LBO00_02345 [Zoogloeaceae bacterium]|jgi:hypothetical protein|nr:hypothetical protein [Zoogloeaceae bacterium]
MHHELMLQAINDMAFEKGDLEMFDVLMIGSDLPPQTPTIVVVSHPGRFDSGG